ncbi:hypothetical protein [Paenibacillus sp. FSL R10-2736]|uniref:hypothetical protein n=1 Tax=Paenibacillus sp. FSL R10-2736 TaxID=2954692 RepID=UPI0030F906F7
MTDQQVRSFGQALAERFKQIGDEQASAERRFRETLYSSTSTRFEVLELERRRDMTKAAFDSWKEVTDNLPFEIQKAFIDHFQKINPTEDK